MSITPGNRTKVYYRSLRARQVAESITLRRNA
jgi:hypothetical protein